MTDTDTLLTTLSRCGWRIIRSQEGPGLLPPALERRYPRLPPDLVSFLECLEKCENNSSTVWFLVRDDFHHAEEGRFRWDFHEQMSLDAADSDQDLSEQIRAYWDQHLPFLFAVHSDYDYLAVDLSPDTFGQIVHGYMPEPEQSTPIAPSFGDFINAFERSLRGEATYPYNLFQ